ncbi:MAG: hypothetical protein ACXWUG_26305 [Polyangiales bacterium]
MTRRHDTLPLRWPPSRRSRLLTEMRALLVAMLLVGCTRAEPKVHEEPQKPAAPKPSVDEIAPLEVACASDGDCAYDYLYLVDGKCCSGTCSPRAVSKGYVVKAAARCKELGHAEDCPTKKCAAPPPLRCLSGTCKLGE